MREAGDALTEAATRWEGDLRARLTEVDESPVAQRVRLDFESPLGAAEAPAGPSSGSKALRAKILGAIGSGGGRLAKNPTAARDAIAAVYKFFGGRFRPWGKVKLGHFLGKAGKVLGPLAIALQGYLDYREDQAKEDAARQLKAFRAEVRAQFQSAVLQLDQALREQGELVLQALYEDPLGDVLAASREVGDADSASKDLLRRFRDLESEVRSVLSNLMT